MKKNSFALLAILLVLVTCTGCDKIFKDLTLKEKTFKFPVAVIASGNGEEYLSFDGEYEGLNLDNEIFKEIQEYRNKPIELSVNSVYLKFDKIAASSEGTIRNLKAIATDASDGTLIVDFYSPENEDIDLEAGYQSAGFTSFLKAVVKALQKDKTINIQAGGETNIIPPDGPGLVLGNLIVTMELYAKIDL